MCVCVCVCVCVACVWSQMYIGMSFNQERPRHYRNEIDRSTCTSAMVKGSG